MQQRAIRPMHTCRKAVLSVLTVAAFHAGIAAFGLLPASAAPPEIRGTWITTTANDDWTTANIATTMSSLKQVGLNTVYVEAWKNGFTNFTSPTLAAFTGTTSLNPSLGGQILLDDSRKAAAASGLVHGAWFEYGSMSQFLGNTGTATSGFNALSRKLRDSTWTVGTTSGTGWLLRDPSGNYTTGSNGFVWMNPLVPEVRNLVKGIVVDAINQFDLQIVQFDDHLAWPQAYGWDTYTAAVYKQETGNNLPASITDSTFAAWRRGKTEAFFAEISDAAKAAKPSVIVSLSPSVIATSSSSFNADWSQWMTKADEVLPQVYRSTISAFNTDWPLQITASGTNVGELGAGLRLLGTGSSTPWNDLRQQIDRTRADGALGHSIWFSNGISNSGTNAADNYNAQLTAYYDVAATGIAANPFFQTVRWSGTGGNGGSGTWSQLASQWKDRSTIWVSTAEGIFDGVGGTVTVSGSVMAESGLDFRTTGYTVTGGTLALRGVTRADNHMAVASGATATIASLLTGSTGLTKTGLGTLAITGTATGLTGGIQIDAGTLRIGSGGTAGQLAAANAITVAAGGTLAFNRSDSYGGNVTNAIGGGGSVRVIAGALTLTASNGYTGLTTIEGGTLALGAAGSLRSSSRVQVAAGAAFNVSALSGGYVVGPTQALAGAGTIVGSVVVGSGATLTPGASPGTLTVTQGATWASGGAYEWQVADAGGSAGMSTGWDLFSVGSTLSITATPADPFKLNLWSLASTGPDVSGSASNFNPALGSTWRIASAAGGISGFSPDKFRVNVSATNGTGGFTNGLLGGTFRLAQAGNDINLVFTPFSGDLVLDVPTGTVKTQADFGFTQITAAASLTKTGGGTLVLDAANPFTGPVTVQGGTLAIAAGSAVAGSAVAVQAGGALTIDPAVTLRAPSLTLGGGRLNAAGTTLIVNGTSGIGQLVITGGTVAGAPGLIVSGGGQVSLPADIRQAVDLSMLSIDQASGGKLDIGKVRINIAVGGISESDLRADLIAGRGAGTFSGTAGIVTTGGPASATSGNAAVGYRVFTSGTAAGSAIVAWAAYGDANLDGQVNTTDISLINNAGKFGQGASTGSVWVEGDFNYSGGVTTTDISLRNNAALFAKGSYLPLTGSALVFGDNMGGAATMAAVPEPGASALALSALLLAPLLAWRRMRYHDRRWSQATVNAKE